MSRRVIEPLLIGNDPHVGQVAEEHQGSILKLFVFGRRRKGGPKAAGAGPIKLYPCRLKTAPNETRAIKNIRSGGSPRIVGAQALIDRERQRLLESGSSSGARRQRRQ